MTGNQPASKRRTASQQHPCPAGQTRSGGGSGHSVADAVLAQVRIGLVTWGHKGTTRSSTWCPAEGQGTAAADQASRGKMAQIKWQRRRRPAQRSCHAI